MLRTCRRNKDRAEVLAEEGLLRGTGGSGKVKVTEWVLVSPSPLVVVGTGGALFGGPSSSLMVVALLALMDLR